MANLPKIDWVIDELILIDNKLSLLQQIFNELHEINQKLNKEDDKSEY